MTVERFVIGSRYNGRRMARKTQLSIRVSQESLTRLRVAALQERRSVSFLIDQAIEEFLSRPGRESAYGAKNGLPELTMRYAPLIDTAVLYAYSVENPSEYASLCRAAGFHIRPEKMEYSELLESRAGQAADFFTLANLVSLRRADDGPERDELFPGALTWKAHFLFVRRDWLNQQLQQPAKAAMSVAGVEKSLCELMAHDFGIAMIRNTFKNMVVACESNTDWNIALRNLRAKYADEDENVFKAQHYQTLRGAFDDFTMGKVPAFGGGIVHTALLLRNERFRKEAVVLARPRDFDCPSTSTIIAPVSILNKYRPGLEQVWESAAHWFNDQLVQNEEIVRSVLRKLYSDDPLLIQADPEEVRRLLRDHVTIFATKKEAKNMATDTALYKVQVERAWSAERPLTTEIQ